MSEDTEKCHKENNNYRRSHLTKDERSPKLYRDVARVLQNVKNKKANVKTALYSANIRRCIFDKVYALTCGVLKHLKVIDRVIEDVKLFVKEPRLNSELAEILIYEICVAQKPLQGNSKPVLIIQQHRKDIEKSFAKQFSTLAAELDSKEEENFVPRYARVNTLVTDVSEVTSALRKKNFYEVVYYDKITLDEYHEKVKQLQSYEFLIDFHFKDLLVFNRYQNLCRLQLYQNGHIFLQDKSSYIPVHVLSPSPGSVVFDTCAAPGMKTVHIAACMENSGKIFATDCDEKRFVTLKETLKRGHVEICKSCCCNFTDIDPHDEQFSSVEYILVDPSCSGSGMVNRMDHITDDERSKSEDRFQKLAGFQVVLLKRALSFPSVKRVVYSTCSVSETENEYVVHEALSHYQHSFQLIPALPEWPTRGQGEYEFSHLCLRSFPKSNLTNGFFVAVFERLKDVSINNCTNEKISSEVMCGQGNTESMSVDSHLSSGNKEIRKIYKREDVEDSVNHTSCGNISKNKKRKSRCSEICTESSSLYGANHTVYEDSRNNTDKSVCEEYVEKPIESITVKKHKKKKSKDYEQNNNPNHEEMAIGSLEKMCENVNESMVDEIYNRKKLKALDQNNSNCDVHQTIDTGHDDIVKENVVEYGEAAVMKRHKKKKHRDAENSSSNCDLQVEHCNVKENVGKCCEATLVKKHKNKKHKGTEYSSSYSNLHLQHSDVQENTEGYEEATLAKRHKKKKHRDAEHNSSNSNLQLGHSGVKENTSVCDGTTVIKKQKKKKHTDAEESSNCNLQVEHCDSMENAKGCDETAVVRRHKKKKHRDEV